LGVSRPFTCGAAGRHCPTDCFAHYRGQTSDGPSVNPASHEDAKSRRQNADGRRRAIGGWKRRFLAKTPSAQRIGLVSREMGGLGDLGGFARKNIPDQGCRPFLVCPLFWMATKSTKDTKAFFVIYVPSVANSLWALGVSHPLACGAARTPLPCFCPLGTGLPSFLFPVFMFS